jgi:hypothetical protein
VRLPLSKTVRSIGQQCGEQFLKPEVAKTIDRILQEGKAPLRTIEVPVYAYEADLV